MEVKVTDNFQAKFALSHDTTLVRAIGDLQRTAYSGKNNLLAGSIKATQDIYVFQTPDFRLYYSIENEDCYLVDFQDLRTPAQPMTSNNPRFNSRINPRFNASINPRFNSRINPRFNASINPRFNSRINPNYNSKLNPRLNWNINPNHNHSLNVTVNRNINPQSNSLINPKINRSMVRLNFYRADNFSNDYYAFYLDDSHELLLVYDYGLNLCWYGVRRETGYSIFNYESLEYEAFMESDGDAGYNWFDLNNNWIYFVK